MFSEVAADLSFHIPAHHSHLLVSLHHRCQSPKKSQKQGGATGKVRSSKNARSPPGAGTLTQLSATDHSATVEAEERGGDFSVARLRLGPTIGEAVTGAGATHTFLVHIANKWSGGELVTWSCTFWDRNMFPGNSFFSSLCLPNSFLRR